MNSTTYTPEVMNQTGRIYDKLESLPAEQRASLKVIAEAYIDGMIARSRLAAQPSAERPSA